MDLSTEYENLINSLVKDGYLKTPEIIEAFKAIDRADFVPEKYKSEAYVNAPLPIDFGQTISQPLTVAFMLELLEPKAGEKILDVGCGSGWVSALLAQIVGEQGKIIAIERIPELKEIAEKNISKYSFIKKEIVEIVLGDGSRGYKKEANYDKIIAAASAQNELPKEWQKQLKIGGRIVAPLGNSIVVIDKIGKNKYNVKEHFGFSFVPLITNN
ncbi:MAG: protein-L-isoaspartate(D-aspartate) O-methyltransferase [Patescibacteria group bacterium]